LTAPRESRRGFTILELVVVVVLLAALPALLLPPLLEKRQAQNEMAAREALAMLATSVRLLPADGPLRLAALCFLVMPESFQPDLEGVVQRQGYLYRDAPVAAPRGCWAWPTMRGYSGRRCFWLDYESGRVFAVEPATWSGRHHPPPEAAPPPEELEPVPS